MVLRAGFVRKVPNFNTAISSQSVSIRKRITCRESIKAPGSAAAV
jgi:hypothetical protein